MQAKFVESEFADTSSKLIEVGCANGKLTNALKKYDIKGIDLEPAFIRIAQKRYPYIAFEALNMLELNTLEKKFDGIVCFGNTLVHLDIQQIDTFVKQCHETLNKNGKLLIQILNYDNVLDNKITALPIIDNDHIKFARKYNLGERLDFITDLTIKATGETISNSINLTPIRKDELSAILTNAGFTNIEFYGSFGRTELKVGSLPLVVSCEV